jgi:hypothetical protein
MVKSASGSTPDSLAKAIFRAGFMVGSLDILGAILVYCVWLRQLSVERLLQGIASGIFRKEAYSGGLTMAFYGLIFHFVIACSFSSAYFILYPHIPLLRRHRLISGIFYGVLIWLTMNLAVLPLVFPDRPGPSWNSFLTGAPILVIMIGLPLSLMAHKYNSSKGV